MQFIEHATPSTCTHCTRQQHRSPLTSLPASPHYPLFSWCNAAIKEVNSYLSFGCCSRQYVYIHVAIISIVCAFHVTLAINVCICIFVLIYLTVSGQHQSHPLAAQCREPANTPQEASGQAPCEAQSVAPLGWWARTFLFRMRVRIVLRMV